jgi:hypothetical protein
MSTMTNHQFIDLLFERIEKIEMAGARQAEPSERLAAMTILRDAMELLRNDPPKAYVTFIRAGLKPKQAPNRILLFGRLAGYAGMLMVQSEDVFHRTMGVVDGPTVQG